MNSRKRVLEALSFKQPDRLPVDFGGTVVSGMHVSCVDALRRYYSLDKHPVKIVETGQMLGLIEDDLKECIGIDTHYVTPPANHVGVAMDEWKEWRTPHGLDVLIPKSFNLTEDENNIYAYPHGDTSCAPSSKMPKSSHFFDTIVRQEPLDDDNLNPEDNLEEFSVYSDDIFEYYKRELTAAAKTGRAVVTSFGGTALGDIALVPAPSLKHPKGIRDIEEWYMSTLIRSDYIAEVFDKQTQIAIKNLERFNNEMGELIDVAFICGTDFGTQIATFCSADTFKELYMPYYKRINGWIHENTGWKTFKHSCGAVEPFIPLLIESGFDILNPIQCSATGMAPALLNERYGGKITFWGGGVDTQKTLPFGNPSEIREQVLSRCEVFSNGGGFIFNAIHNVQAYTPVENIVAMIDAVKEFNGVV